jgi:malate dehydrogenase (oxaloacetate-decarboxylating)
MTSDSIRRKREPVSESKNNRRKSRYIQSSSTRTGDVSKLAVKYSEKYGGKIQTVPKVPISNLADFSIWYTPGVAAVSRKVARDTDLSFEYTNRWNNLCILTDGSRVLGLGDIGPEGSLPVMEGKALIYKVLGGVDAFPIPISAHETDQIVEFATFIQPAFGAIHLEDISSPKCFEILDLLRQKLAIPVWHDDQQGTAGVTLAALLNSLILTNRELDNAKIVLFGAGAANIAAAKLLQDAGFPAGNLIVIDSKGILHPEREDMDHMMLSNKWKYELALTTNETRVSGDVNVAAEGADVLIAASTPGPNVLSSSTLKKMNKNAILFALSNPIPEIWPDAARKAGVRIIATGRSDFPNQVNNSLLFPSIIRGVLDVRSKAIPDEVIVVAAQELAKYTRDEGTLNDNHILPTMMDREIYPIVASAVGEKCVKMGIARKSIKRSEIEKRARAVIEHSTKMISSLQERHLIEPLPKHLQAQKKKRK